MGPENDSLEASGERRATEEMMSKSLYSRSLSTGFLSRTLPNLATPGFFNRLSISLTSVLIPTTSPE